MGKAYQCDACFDCYTGAPDHILEDGREICHNCFRVMKYFGQIDDVSDRNFFLNPTNPDEDA